MKRGDRIYVVWDDAQIDLDLVVDAASMPKLLGEASTGQTAFPCFYLTHNAEWLIVAWWFYPKDPEPSYTAIAYIPIAWIREVRPWTLGRENLLPALAPARRGAQPSSTAKAASPSRAKRGKAGRTTGSRSKSA